MEIFKDIIELDSQYSISNYGKVIRKRRTVKSSIQKSGFRTIKEKEANLQDNGKGYKQIYVSINKKRIVLYIHRLVAKYFIDNPNNLNEVNHIDGNKSNNNFNNLEWVTRKDNAKHSYNLGLSHKGEKCSYSKLNELQVRCILRLHSINPNFNKSRIARKLNVSDTTIHKIINKQRWKHVII